MDAANQSASSRKAYRSHVTCLLKKIEEITGNGTVPTVEEPQLTSLITTVEQLESKSSILTELDSKGAEAITDPDQLESEIFRAVEIQDSISEYTRLAKRIIDRSECPQPQPLTAPPLNANAAPYQPVQTNLTPPSTVGEQSATDVPNITTTLSHSEGYSKWSAKQHSPGYFRSPPRFSIGSFIIYLLCE